MYSSDSEDSSSDDSEGSGTSEREYARGHMSDTDGEEEEEEVVAVVDKRKSKEKGVTMSKNNRHQEQRLKNRNPKEKSVTMSKNNRHQKELPKAPVTKSLNNRHQKELPKALVVNTQLKTLPVKQKRPKPLPEFIPSKSSHGTQKIIGKNEKQVYYHKHKEPPLTRREYMETRRKIHKWKDPGVYEPPKAKKVPGRHAKNFDNVMEGYHKVFTAEQFDIQSDYEGYLSDVEVCDHAPRLKRSQSSESIFLDDEYVQFSQKKLSAIHEQCLHSSILNSTKQRRLTMKRIRHKHSLNYGHLTLERTRFKELNENENKAFRATAAEIEITKKCIRVPAKFKKANIPRVYTHGDAPMIDDIFNLLKDTVSIVVEMEHKQTACKIWMSQEIQEARVNRRKILETLPIKQVSRLPKPEYLCMEMLHLRKVISREQLEYEKRLARRQMRIMAARLPIDKQLQQISRAELMIRRNDDEFEKYWKDVVNRTKQLENSSKIESIPHGTLQHHLEKEQVRALKRRKSNSQNPKLLEGINNMIKMFESAKERRKRVADVWKPAYARMENELFQREQIERNAHLERKKRAIRTILDLANNLKKTVKNNEIHNEIIPVLEVDSDDDDFEIQRMAEELHEEASKSVKAKRAEASAKRQRLIERNTSRPAPHRNLFPTSPVEVCKNTSVSSHNKKRDSTHREDDRQEKNKKRKYYPRETTPAQEDDGYQIHVENIDHIERDEEDFESGGIDNELMREESALDMYPEVKTEYMENGYGEIVESQHAVRRSRKNKKAGPSVSVDEYEKIDDDIFMEPVAKKPRHMEDEASDRTPSPPADNDGNNFLLSDNEYEDDDDEDEDREHDSDGDSSIYECPIISSPDGHFKTNLLYLSKHPDVPSYKDARNALGSCKLKIKKSHNWDLILGLKNTLNFGNKRLFNYLKVLKKAKRVSKEPLRKLFDTIAGFFKYCSAEKIWTFEFDVRAIFKHFKEKQMLEFMKQMRKVNTLGFEEESSSESEDPYSESDEEGPSSRQLPVNLEEDLTRMADSETADIMSRNRFSGVALPSSLTLRVTKTSSNAWVAPVKPVESAFWGRIQCLQHSWHKKDAKKDWENRINQSIELDLAQKLEEDKSIANLAKLRDLSDWVYPTLALCHLFLTGEGMEPVIISSKWSLNLTNTKVFEETLKSLKRAAIYLRDACQIPENLFSLLEFNNFPLLFQAMNDFLQTFLKCVADVKVVYEPEKPWRKKKIIEKKMLFSWLLIQLGKKFEYKLRTVKEEFLISEYLLTSTEYVEDYDHVCVDSDDDDYKEDIGVEEDEELAREIRKAATMGQQEKFEKLRVIRINTLKKWYEHAMKANSTRIQVFRGCANNIKSLLPVEKEKH